MVILIEDHLIYFTNDCLSHQFCSLIPSTKKKKAEGSRYVMFWTADIFVLSLSLKVKEQKYLHASTEKPRRFINRDYTPASELPAQDPPSVQEAHTLPFLQAMPERASAHLSAEQHHSDPESTSRDPSGQMGVAYFECAQLRHYTRLSSNCSHMLYHVWESAWRFVGAANKLSFRAAGWRL